MRSKDPMSDQKNSGLAKNILLADDEQFIDLAFTDGLRRFGFSVAVATDGEEAYSLLRSNPPDALLLELVLPKLNGFELLQKMHRDKLLRNIPVIVLTRLSQISDANEARQYGAHEVLVKSDTSLQDVIRLLTEIFTNE